MCENRVNTHSHRAYFTNYFLNIKALASREKKGFLVHSPEAQQCFDTVIELAKSNLDTFAHIIGVSNRYIMCLWEAPVFISVDSIQKASNNIVFSNFRNPRI